MSVLDDDDVSASSYESDSDFDSLSHAAISGPETLDFPPRKRTWPPDGPRLKSILLNPNILLRFVDYSKELF